MWRLPAQVYRATLNPSLGGAEVAVKVQRPHVLASVALDLFLMRWVAIASQSLPQVQSRTLPGSDGFRHLPMCMPSDLGGFIDAHYVMSLSLSLSQQRPAKLQMIDRAAIQ